MHKARSQHLPGKAVVLQQSRLAAFDHGIVLLVLHQQSYHRELGHDGGDAVGDALVLRPVQEGGAETGSVVVVHRGDPPLDRRRAVDRAVHR